MITSKEPLTETKRAMICVALGSLHQDEVTRLANAFDEQFTILMEEKVAGKCPTM